MSPKICDSRTTFKSQNCSTTRFKLLSVNVTASKNNEALDKVIFVISVNVKSLDENEYIRFASIKRNNSSMNSDKDDTNEMDYKDEKRRIVNNDSLSKSSEPIALLEYDCCSDRVNLEKSNSAATASKEEKESLIDYNRSDNDSSNNEHVFEDIT